ncbi:MAG: hypothetical protein IJ560_01635 [Alphaproteobacteria bacterium]|nr:hypothetical protein [Alphaproteobacteria bacterium]
MENIENCFARAFAGPSGAAVMAHLRRMTVERVLGANATDAELRMLEGQRALVHKIETLITRGQGG